MSISINDEAAVVVREDGKVIRVLLKHNGNPPELYNTDQATFDQYKDLLKREVGYKLEQEAKVNNESAKI